MQIVSRARLHAATLARCLRWTHLNLKQGSLSLLLTAVAGDFLAPALRRFRLTLCFARLFPLPTPGGFAPGGRSPCFRSFATLLWLALTAFPAFLRRGRRFLEATLFRTSTFRNGFGLSGHRFHRWLSRWFCCGCGGRSLPR